MTSIEQALIDSIAERVAARLRPSSGALNLEPCAIPPPGSPRYAAAMRGFDQDEAKATEHEDGHASPFPETLTRPASSGAPELAAKIDHTQLAPEAAPADIDRLCRQAREYGFFSVCVAGQHVRSAAEALADCEVKVCAVVGFPLGSSTSRAKAFEAVEAVSDGADEIDMVAAIGRIKAGDHDYVYRDIRAVVRASRSRPIKVILETALLDDEEIVAGCVIAREAGAAFVKTSTGFGPGGATAREVALMRSVVGTAMGVKAAGGIRDAAAAREMIRAGASRVGASASVKIVTGCT